MVRDMRTSNYRDAHSVVPCTLSNLLHAPLNVGIEQ
jgi:hypothetical protein